MIRLPLVVVVILAVAGIVLGAATMSAVGTETVSQTAAAPASRGGADEPEPPQVSGTGDLTPAEVVTLLLAAQKNPEEVRLFRQLQRHFTTPEQAFQFVANRIAHRDLP